MKVDLFTQIIGDGLPEPKREVRVCPGRKWRWDYCWEEEKIAVEFQGGTWSKGGHVRGKQYRSDCEKMVAGQLQGYFVIWVTTDMVADSTALSLIKRAFEYRKNQDFVSDPA